MADVLTIKLTGIGGYSKGREFIVEEGGQAVMGRSRSCDFNLSEHDDETEPPEEKPFKGTGGKDEHLHTVSRQHVTIEFRGPKAIFITDTSKHGTFLNGNRVDGRDQIIGLRKAPVELRLGTNETFRMELMREEVRPGPKITVKRRED